MKVEGEGSLLLSGVVEISDSSSDADSNVAASSDSSTPSDLPEVDSRNGPRLFLPPQPPEGGEFLEHKKLKTLHGLMDGYERVFLCGRTRNEMYCVPKEVRWDSSVCHSCLKKSAEG